MKPDFLSILEDSLLRLHQGQALEDCLKLYPQHASELLPLLRATRHLQELPSIQPRLNAIESGRKRMLARARLEVAPIRKELIGLKLVFRLAVSLIVFVLLGSFFVINVTASSLPGDLLYGVKRGWEAIRLDLAINDQSRQALSTRYNQVRRNEIRNMISAGLDGTLTIEGVLENEVGETWTVSGLQVITGPRTIIEGTKAIGAWLTMELQIYQNGQVFALRAVFSTQVKSIPTFEANATFRVSPSMEALKKTIEPTAIKEPTGTQVPTEDTELHGDDDPTEEVKPTEDFDPTEEVEPTDVHNPTEEGKPTDTPEQTPGVEPTDEFDP